MEKMTRGFSNIDYVRNKILWSARKGSTILVFRRIVKILFIIQIRKEDRLKTLKVSA